MTAEQIVEAGFYALAGYLAIGLLVALLIQAAFLTKMDPRAKGAGIAFRILIMPGLAILWPIMLVKAVKAKGGSA